MKRMSVAKAKMYKTAQFIPEAWEIPEGFTAGEFVAVSFLYQYWGSCVFQCTNVNGATAVICDLALTRFSTKMTHREKDNAI